jgi:hypothetical protein
VTAAPVRRARLLLVAAVVLALGAAACSSSGSSKTGQAAGTTAAPVTSGTVLANPAASPVPSPTVTGPVTGGTPAVAANAMPTAWKNQYHYREQEYFIAGTATAYRAQGALNQDGTWSVAPAGTAPYKTRLLVREPTDPKKFNGTVVVEWLNVTAGRDSDADFGFAGPELLRDGYAYVGVSAQATGVVGGGGKIPIPGYNPLPLVQQNPTRYAGLTHPGDDYSYDIFSQAAQAIRRPDGPNPLGGLHPKVLIATGESQSAFRMVTYVDAIATTAHLFDGYLIHSRGPNGAALSSAPGAAPMPKVVHIRADLGKPVLQLQTETDLFGLGFYPARQPDTTELRTWEMAGTSHADQSTLDYGIASGAVWAPGEKAPDFTSLCGTINDGPQGFIERKAVASLDAWVRGGAPPATSPTFVVTGGTEIARDAQGNAVGGIRTPAVDVPVSTLTGVANPKASVICSLFGQTTPLPAATLAALYPSHAAYVAKVTADAKAAQARGFLLPADVATIIGQARSDQVP